MKPAKFFPLLILILPLIGMSWKSPSPETEISYQRDIRPLMITYCAIPECHDGTLQPDLRELRVIQFYKKRIEKRLTSLDQPMPPAEAESQLTPVEKANIIMWIQSGAPDN